MKCGNGIYGYDHRSVGLYPLLRVGVILDSGKDRKEFIMDIIIKDTSGNRLGYISGENVKDNGGNRAGYISGGDIKDNSGNRIGFINGNDIKDTYGNRVGYISGSDIKDTYGNRVGYVDGNASPSEMAAAALLLFDLKPEVKVSKESDSEGVGSAIVGTIIAVILMGAWAALKGIFKGFVFYFSDGAFNFEGTATRTEWWLKLLSGVLVLFVATLILGGLVLGLLQSLPDVVQIIILFIGIIFVMIPIFAVSVRRMHDMGKRGWWILIPIVGFVMCAFFPGKVDGNSYI